MFHLLICCFGGQPFVDFDKRGDSLNSKYRSLQPIDPTDWTAEETPLGKRKCSLNFGNNVFETNNSIEKLTHEVV